MEFSLIELKDTKDQLFDIKKAHEATIKAFEMSLSENKSLITEKDILEMKENHLNEKKLLEQEILNLKKGHFQQIEVLNEKLNELELKGQIAENDYKKELEALREAVEAAEASKLKLQSNLKSFDSQKVRIMKELEEKYLIKVNLLEEESDALKKSHLMEIRILQSKFEENLRNLKELYESERIRFEKKIIDDKERSDRKNNQIIEEYEIKIIEITNNFEEETRNLKEELKETETQIQDIIQKYDHELNLRQKSFENMETSLNDTKEDLAREKENSKQEIEKLQKQWYQERGGLLEKIETIVKELNNKENELANAQQRINQLMKGNEGRDDALENLKSEFAKEREELNNKLDETKKK